MTSLSVMQKLAETQQENDNEMRRLLLSDEQTIGDVNMPGEGLDAMDLTLDEEQMLGAVDAPHDNCCWLYDQLDFDDHTPFQVCHNGEKKIIDLSSWYNDRAQSYVCGKNMTLTMCDNEWHRCSHYGSSSGRINNPHIGWAFKNKLTSVSVEPYDARNHGAANLFAFSDCAGNASAFPHLGRESKTFYNSADLDRKGVGRDEVSSVRVAAGYVVELYEHNSQAGNVQTIIGQQDEDGQMPCVNVRDNDTISSIVVRPIKMGNSVGYWQGITATETQKFKYTVGVTSTYDQEITTWHRQMMSNSMELGIDFLDFASASASIGLSFEQEITHDINQQLRTNYTREVETTCTASNGEGSGFWQWVVRTEDGSVVTQSFHTVCKTGNDFNQAPKCPWNACTTPDCSSCAAGWQDR